MYPDDSLPMAIPRGYCEVAFRGLGSESGYTIYVPHSCAVQGGFYLRPSDTGSASHLSPGTPVVKSHLAAAAPGKAIVEPL